MNVLPAVRAWLLGLCLTTPGVHALTCTNASITPSNPDANYTVNADDTVTHKPTGLVWKRCSEGQSWNGNTCSGTATAHTWAQALTLAKSSSFAGRGDWRLPNMKELLSLVEECRGLPFVAINDSVFSGTSSSYYWSGSPYADSSTYAWGVHFGGGNAYFSDRSGSQAVRLVSKGQSFSPLAPSCTLSANPSSITAGDSTTLTAQCSQAAVSYVWTGGSCAGTNASSDCITSPGTTTSYSVAGVNAVGIGPVASVTVTVVPATPLGCESSNVATITANGYAYADKYQAFDVMCQSGRYGVVRLPQWYLPGLLKVCAFQQGSCQAKPSAQCTSSPSIEALKTINDNRTASTSALLTDPTLGPLANWICQ